MQSEFKKINKMNRKRRISVKITKPQNIERANPFQESSDLEIKAVIEQIWDTYDADKSGDLDKEETWRFVKDTLGNLGSGDDFS